MILDMVNINNDITSNEATRAAEDQRSGVRLIDQSRAPASIGSAAGEMNDFPAQVIGRFVLADADDRRIGEFGLENRSDEIAMIAGSFASRFTPS